MPKFILTADLHIRSDIPRCRVDEDWEETQRLMINEIISVANKYKVPLVITGDLFDSPNIPARFIVMLINEFSKIKDKVYFLAGNHELPYHSLQNIDNSSIGIFSSMAKNHNKIIEGMAEFGLWSHFNCKYEGTNSGLLFIHKLVFENNKSLPPNVQAITAQELLDKYENVNWIFTGDNHQCFHYEKNGRHVVNPGCSIRQKTDEQEYKPSVFYIDTEKEIVERIFLSDDIKMVDDNYIIEEKEKIDRISAFVEAIKHDEKITLDFIENIETGIEKNKKVLNKETVKVIRELIGEDENNDRR